jgi:hypothetical protein
MCRAVTIICLFIIVRNGELLPTPFLDISL